MSTVTRRGATGPIEGVLDLIDAVDAEVAREERRGRAASVRAAAAAARQVAAAERRPFRVLVLLVAVLTALLGLQAAGLGPFPRAGESVPAAEVRRAVLGGLNFAVRQIEAYRRRTGELPDDLSAVGLSRRFGWSYEPLSPGRYRIALDAEGYRESYDSILDADTFFAEVRDPQGD